MILFFKKHKITLLAIITCISCGFISGYLSGSGNSSWYLNLKKPTFNPPSWIFPPVWSTLYILMGITFGLAWKLTGQAKKTLCSLFTFQFLLNLFWSPLFFFYHRIDLALYNISMLWAILLAFCLIAWKSKKIITYLTLPYLAWISFAWVLTWNVYQLNNQ